MRWLADGFLSERALIATLPWRVAAAARRDVLDAEPAYQEGILYRTFLVRSAWISAGRTAVIQAEVPVRCGVANGCRLTG